MEGPITDGAREAMLQAALSRVDVRAFRESLQQVTDPPRPDLQADRQCAGGAGQAP